MMLMMAESITDVQGTKGARGSDVDRVVEE